MAKGDNVACPTLLGPLGTILNHGIVRLTHDFTNEDSCTDFRDCRIRGPICRLLGILEPYGFDGTKEESIGKRRGEMKDGVLRARPPIVELLHIRMTHRGYFFVSDVLFQIYWILIE